MPFTVQQLIEGRPQPVTTTPDKPIQMALDLMVERDFSQLPVVDDNGGSLGLITSDSILRALNYFETTVKDLRVSHAIIKAPEYRADNDLFDLLDALRDTYVILVVDVERIVTGIVTSYDATEFFRRRAEDTMLVEDIESALKDHIRAAFVDAEGEPDETALAAAVTEILNSRYDNRKQFKGALANYLGLQKIAHQGIDQQCVEDVFARHFARDDTPASLDDLTLNEYTQILLRKDTLARIDADAHFELKPEAMRRLLDQVRKTRNALMHFRGSISAQQRDMLRFCADWLGRTQIAIPAPPLNTAMERAMDYSSTTKGGALTKARATVSSNSGNLSQDDSRFAFLARYLQNLGADQGILDLTFDEIERIIEGSLPAIAREHRSWWANDSESYAHPQQWLDTGWRVSAINIPEGKVTFARRKGMARFTQLME